MLEQLGIAYGNAVICPERNNHGALVVHVLEIERGYRALWHDIDAQGRRSADVGIWTGPANRLVMIDDLADAIAEGEFVTPDRVITDQARTFVRSKVGKIQAEDGCDDDGIAAAWIGWRAIFGRRTNGPRRGAAPDTTATG